MRQRAPSLADRETRIQIAEYVIGHRLAKGVHLLPGARNRILFGVQGRRFKTEAQFANALVALVGNEEFPSWMHARSIKPNWIFP